MAAWWKFDEGAGNAALDSVSQTQDKILGNFKWLQGSSGTGLKFDGFTALVSRAARNAPRTAGAFSVEAWIAIQEYPLNWVAVVDHEKNRRGGYFFGVDSEGRLGLHLAVSGKWRRCTSGIKLPLMKWAHVVGTYGERSGIALYVDGKAVGKLSAVGRMTPAEGMALQIGRSHKKLPPTALVRPEVSFPASYSFDGIIDELKIYRRTLTAKEVAAAYAAGKPQGDPALSPRRWPSIPDEPKRFGAVYCKLKFYEEWDALWRVGPHADVVVRFDEAPYKLVFWRGTNYNGNLVTENGIWVGDQSAESGTRHGCAEHMSDKQNRYSHVRVVENTDARVVVHWRYGLVDVLYQFSNVDPVTGWGDWADEYYYIYPDGVVVRSVTIRGTAPAYSITEPTILNEPGKKAEDYVSLDAVTMVNMQGESRTYSWEFWPPSPFPAPHNANISMLNLKSTYKPFYIYQPGTLIIPYGNPAELRPEFSHFPTWNHWPVNQAPSDGRYALATDRFASAAVTSPEPVTVDGPGPTKRACFILGLTDRAAAELAPLARSWVQAPKLRLVGEGFSSAGYDIFQRAYVLARSDGDKHSSLDFVLEAGEDSPVVNPSFVIQGWGDKGAALRIDGKEIGPGKDFRLGRVHRLEGTDLVVWIRLESFTPVRMTLTSEGY